MYKYKLQDVLDPAFLTKLIAKFKEAEQPRFTRDEQIYRVKTKILTRTMDDGKPNNKLAHGFARYISNMATSYFMGRPVRYEAEDPAYQETLGDVLQHNYIDSVNYEASKEASKKGVGYLLLFINEASELRIKCVKPESIIPVYSTSLDDFLECCVRIWSEYDIDGNLQAEYADVYDKQYIYHYVRPRGQGNYQKRGGLWDTMAGKQVQYQTRHMLSDIPLIVIFNNEDQIGDYEPHVSLFDAYDAAQSDTANDMDYFTDAYLCITGAGGGLETETLDPSADAADQTHQMAKTLRQDRLLLLDEGGQASWLVKSINDTATEHYKDRLYRDIFFLAQVPALTDESFAGNLSGIAIKYKLIGLEELAIMKENKFRSAQTKLIKIVTAYINQRMNKSYDPGTVKQTYERNFIDNVADIITNAKNLEGITSKETQLQQLPNSVVPDAKEELERIRQEQLADEELPYPSGAVGADLVDESGDKV